MGMVTYLNISQKRIQAFLLNLYKTNDKVLRRLEIAENGNIQ